MSDLKGKRALVTGASGGIGAAIAIELAARGATVVLSARRRAQLEQVAAKCQAAGGTTEIVVGDLGKAGGAHATWQASTASGAKVDILINNAGFGYFRAFGTIEASRDAELVQLNITSLVELTRLFLDHRHGSFDRAYLLNISSIAAYQSVPNNALYSASKAFVRNFTEGLHGELRGSPVSATCICPGGTKTDFHAMAGAGDYSWIANFSMMSAERVARIGVKAMLAGKRNVIPGVMNKISCFGVRLVPRAFASWMSRRVLGRPRAGELPARSSVA
jgi:short-subunit dehydrogenase